MSQSDENDAFEAAAKPSLSAMAMAARPTAYLDDLNTGDESFDLFRLHVNPMPDEYLQTTPPGRIVCDFIAGMTDEFLVNQYSKRFVPCSFGLKL